MAYGSRRYQSGRGYSGGGGGQRGAGFWSGRPEFTGADSNYDRWTIRPLTVARGNHANSRIGWAAKVAGKELWNYKRRGGAEGVRERMAMGGEEYGEAMARGLMSPLTQAPDVGSRGLDPNPTRPDPRQSGGNPLLDADPPDPGSQIDFDWDKAGQVVGNMVTVGKQVAANPTVQAAAKGAVGGAIKGSKFGLTGAVTGAVMGGGRAAVRANNTTTVESRAGTPLPSLDPFGVEPPARKSFEGTTWENIRGS